LHLIVSTKTLISSTVLCRKALKLTSASILGYVIPLSVTNLATCAHALPVSTGPEGAVAEAPLENDSACAVATAISAGSTARDLMMKVV
jgi:hypothetical protein